MTKPDQSPSATHVIVTDGRTRHTVAFTALPRRMRRIIARSPAPQLRRRVLRWGATAVVVLGIAAAPIAATQANFPATFNLGALSNSSIPRGSTLAGATTGERAGYASSGAGDVNGDGFADVIIGAPAADPNGRTDAGAAYVVFGSAAGIPDNPDLLSLNGSNGFVLTGEAEYDQTGFTVSNAGDVNRDGFDDVIIGAYRANPNGRSNAGAAYVVFGKADWTNSVSSTLNAAFLNGSNGFVLAGAASSEWAGFAVSGGGDVNGDGFADVVVGARLANSSNPFRSDTGAAYVVFGKADWRGTAMNTLNASFLNGSNGFTLQGAAAADQAGNAVSNAGDVNADGFDDILVGASAADPDGRNYAGIAYVVFGKADWNSSATLNLGVIQGSNGFVLAGALANDRAGRAVSTAGDVNGDGFADVVVGANATDFPQRNYAGAVYIVFGKADWRSTPTSVLNNTVLDGVGGFTLEGGASSDRAGSVVGGGSDVNGDGFADVIVGAPDADPAGVFGAGAAYVVFGKADWRSTVNLNLATLGGSDGFILGGAAANDLTGSAVSMADDVNGDGFADVIVGAPYADANSTSSGAAYVVLGNNASVPAPPTATSTGTAAPAPPTATSTGTAAPAPLSISSITPDKGISNTITNVTITGSGFTSGLSILLGSLPLADVSVVNSTTLLAVVPAPFPPGTFDLTIIAPDGTTAVLNDAFTVTATAPVIVAVQPATGIAGRANTLIVSGFNFANGTQMVLGDTPLPTIRNSATSLQATVPDSVAAGTYDVLVRNPGNVNSTLQSGYTLIANALDNDLLAETYDLFTEPAALRAGEPMQLGLVVTRRGGTATLRNVAVAFYVQQGDAEQQLVGTAQLDLLGPNSVQATSITLAAPLTTGSYTVSAVIDPQDTIPEDASDNNTISRTFTVLPPNPDRIAPRVSSFVVNKGNSTISTRDVLLDATASDPTVPPPASGIAGLYFVEYLYLESAGQWVPVQNSQQFLPYAEASRNYPWTLASVSGMRYLQAWASDAAGNISLAPSQRLISYIPPTDTVGRDQTQVARVELAVGDTLTVSIAPTNGDPDLYVWLPAMGEPPYVSNLNDGTDTVTLTVQNSDQAGTYQIEVYGYTAATYTQRIDITRGGGAVVQQGGGINPDKVQRPSPAVPLNSVPIQQSVPGAGVTSPASQVGRVYLPVVRR